jgi:L-ascorbate metabolism protein UlaG (beta-lactamase superfamily)
MVGARDGENLYKAVDAYNTKRFRSPGVPFHPKGFGMGILFKVQGVSLYYAGDTDLVEEMTSLRDEDIDLAFLPIGGKYTMNLDEAVEAAGVIQPKCVTPVHYNHLKGTEADPEEFRAEVEKRWGIKIIVM